MPSSGPLSPATVLDDASVGTVAWLLPGNATSSDDLRATAALASGEVSHYLKATGFGFAVPSGATIDGIVVEIERSSSSAINQRDSRVRIVKGGAIGATDRADTSTNWPTTDAYKTYGSSSDLWGETWTPADINASTFGATIAATNTAGATKTASVDHIRITVYYTEPGAIAAVIPVAVTVTGALVSNPVGVIAATIPVSVIITPTLTSGVVVPVAPIIRGGLDWGLYNLSGQRLGGLGERKGGQVTIPLNGRRYAQVSIDMADPLAELVAPLSTVLRAWWWGRPIFAGPVTLPRYITTEDPPRVEINAIDPSFRLARSFVNQRSDSGLLAYQAGVDQAQIMKRLIDHARPTASELTAGTPDIPILDGSLPTTVNRDREYETGKEIWQAIIELSQVKGGLDFELEPVAPGTAMTNTHALARLNTFARQGSDKSATVRFTSGYGWENCEVVWEPSGDLVANRVTVQGQSEEGQPPPAYTSQQIDSRNRYGIYGDYQSRSDVSETTTLQEHAQGKASVAAFPIDFFDIIPAVDGRGYTRDPADHRLLPVKDRRYGVPPRFGPGADFDYWVGDTVGCFARHPTGIDGLFTSRVTDATITEVEETGDAVVALSLAPDIPVYGVT